MLRDDCICNVEPCCILTSMGVDCAVQWPCWSDPCSRACLSPVQPPTTWCPQAFALRKLPTSPLRISFSVKVRSRRNGRESSVADELPCAASHLCAIAISQEHHVGVVQEDLHGEQASQQRDAAFRWSSSLPRRQCQTGATVRVSHYATRMASYLKLSC